jgi:DNA polymerase III subunit alpha
MPLEEVPGRFTRQVHLRLHTAHLTPKSIEALGEVVAAHPGKCPVMLCFVRTTGEVIFLETHERFSVKPSAQLQQTIDNLFGENTYYAKVDTTLPERAARRWERRADDNGDE